MQNIYAPKLYEDEKYQIVEIASLVSNIAKDHLFHVDDFSLSKYFVFAHMAHPNQLNYLYELFNREILEYPLETIFCCKGFEEVRNRNLLDFTEPTLEQIRDVKFVEQKINEIND